LEGKSVFLKKTAKEIIKKGNYMFRFSTCYMRVLPDFLIVGAQKCGTSSLYRNLVKHPSIAPAFVKEIYFYSRAKCLKWEIIKGSSQ
jgi:hypothetical protein